MKIQNYEQKKNFIYKKFIQRKLLSHAQKWEPHPHSLNILPRTEVGIPYIIHIPTRRSWDSPFPQKAIAIFKRNILTTECICKELARSSTTVTC